jgi:hypothetical protein
LSAQVVVEMKRQSQSGVSSINALKCPWILWFSTWTLLET